MVLGIPNLGIKDTLLGKSKSNAWCLVVKLTFDKPEKVDKLKAIFTPYAQFIREKEPTTLAYEMFLSDKECTLESVHARTLPAS